MKRQFIAVVLCLPFLLAAPASAKMYKWRDANGVLHFSQEPPPGQAVEEYHEVRRPESAYKKPPAVTTYPKQGATPSSRQTADPAASGPEYPAADAAYQKLVDLANTVTVGVNYREYQPMVRNAVMRVGQVRDRDRHSALRNISDLYGIARVCWHADIFVDKPFREVMKKTKPMLWMEYSITADSYEECRSECWSKAYELLEKPLWI